MAGDNLSAGEPVYDEHGTVIGYQRIERGEDGKEHTAIRLFAPARVVVLGSPPRIAHLRSTP